jgi:hypothetical protein
MIQLGQIRSVNILTEKEKPFSNYEFFTIGTAARIYYFCVKVSCFLSLSLPSSSFPSSSLLMFLRMNTFCPNGLKLSYNANSVSSPSLSRLLTLPLDIAPSFSPTTKMGIAFESSDQHPQPKETSPNSNHFSRSSLTIMGDNLPEEPEACVVNPGNFSSSTSRVLNHRCVIFRGTCSLPR